MEASNWEHLPPELLFHILTLVVDDRTIILASGVCTNWRNALHVVISRLSFRWCNNNTNITKLVTSLACNKLLQSFQLSMIHSVPYILMVEAVKDVAFRCHDLLDLNLSKGTFITDDSLLALAEGCRSLEKLNLGGCTKITEHGVIVVARCCTRLKSLNLCGCSKAATDLALLALAENCVSLQELNVGWCSNTITDVGVTRLASSCSDLRSIDLCDCVRITDQSVIALADNCSRLHSLSLYGCVHITDVAMYALANSSKYRAFHANPKKRYRPENNTSYISYSERSINRSGSRSICDYISQSKRSCTVKNTNEVIIAASCKVVMEPNSNAGAKEGDFGLCSLNVSQCRYNLSVQALQAVCDAFPGLHTCARKRSLNITGCLPLTPAHCACVKKS